MVVSFEQTVIAYSLLPSTSTSGTPKYLLSIQSYLDIIYLDVMNSLMKQRKCGTPFADVGT